MKAIHSKHKKKNNKKTGSTQQVRIDFFFITHNESELSEFSYCLNFLLGWKNLVNPSSKKPYGPITMTVRMYDLLTYGRWKTSKWRPPTTLCAVNFVFSFLAENVPSFILCHLWQIDCVVYRRRAVRATRQKSRRSCGSHSQTRIGTHSRGAEIVKND